MRCIACDKALTDSEAVKKSPNTGEYLDMCSHCLADIDMYEDDGWEESELEEDGE